MLKQLSNICGQITIKENIKNEYKDKYCELDISQIIEFVNPFPEEPTINPYDLVRNTLKFIEALRWEQGFMGDAIPIVSSNLNTNISKLFEGDFIYNNS